MNMQEKAFPNPHLTHETGMTLRDYFAARAMQSMIQDRGSISLEQGGYTSVSIMSYKMADAMLKVREQE